MQKSELPEDKFFKIHVKWHYYHKKHKTEVEKIRILNKNFRKYNTWILLSTSVSIE